MACAQTISGLAKDCEVNMGGIRKVFIAIFDDVASVTETNNQISAITMDSTKKFKTFLFADGSASFKTTPTYDRANGVHFYTTELTMVFSRMETVKRIEMAALSLSELAVIVQDKNGLYWYLGHDEPVAASAGEGATGTARADRNGYSITLQDNSLDWPMEVASDAIATIVDDAPASAS